MLHAETITDGGNGTWATQPTHDATPAYTFAFIGWSRTANSTTADATATQAVTANRNVYAAYTLTGRTYTVTFAKNSADGGGTLQTVNNVPYGGSATYTGSTPTSTRGNDFTFDGWSPTPTNIQGNTTCYAVFRDTSLPLYKYLSLTMTAYESDSTATKVAQYAFYNMTTLETVETTALTIEQYAFSGCTKLREVDLKATSGQVSIAAYAFNACSAMTTLIIRSSTMATLASSNALPTVPFTALNGAIYVPANLVDTYKAATNWSVYANRIYPISAYPVTNFDTIQDSWAEIVNKINAGTHTYQIGDTKSVTYGGDKTVQMELVSLATEGTAKTAWIMKNFVETKAMNTFANGGMKPYDETAMHTYMNEIYESLPSELRAGIKAVDKTWYDGVNNTVKTTSEKVWLPSSREVGLTGGSLKESEGMQYTTKFTNSTSRVKYSLTTGSATNWWLRSSYNSSDFIYIGTSGYSDHYGPNFSYGIAIGFCI